MFQLTDIMEKMPILDPLEEEYIKFYYILRNQTAPGFNGHNPISLIDIKLLRMSVKQGYYIDISTYIIDKGLYNIILAADSAFMKYQYEKQKEEDSKRDSESRQSKLKK